jgi:hypothetical protein
MVVHTSKWKSLNKVEKKKPGRPKKDPELKRVKVEILLDHDQYMYLARRAKINYSSQSEEARAILDNEMENHPDELLIQMRDETLNQQKAYHDNIKKIYYEDREHRILVATSMIKVFLEDNPEPIKEMFIHARLEARQGDFPSHYLIWLLPLLIVNCN